MIGRGFWLLAVAVALFAAQEILREALAAYRDDTLGSRPALMEQLEKEAAKDRNAAFLLATVYKNGKAGPRDEEAAFRWYREAAGMGDPDAMLMLGWLYYRGSETVRRNDRKAAYWFRRAADLGVDEAVEIVRMLEE